jgi:hypothetical protein
MALHAGLPSPVEIAFMVSLSNHEGGTADVRPASWFDPVDAGIHLCSP